MVKDVDGYLLTGSINRKFIVKVRPFSSAKTIDMESPKRHLNQSKLHFNNYGTQSLLKILKISSVN